MRGKILRRTNPGIGHDSGPTADFVCGRAIAIAAGAISTGGIKGMIRAELVADFVHDIINIVRIAHRIT